MEFISSFFSTPLWHFFDNPLCKNQKIRFIRSTRENIKKRHRNIEKKIRSLASGNVLTQGFFSPERKGKKNSAVSRKRRKRKFLQVSLLKKCKVGVRRDRTYKLCILSGKISSIVGNCGNTIKKKPKNSHLLLISSFVLCCFFVF